MAIIAEYKENDEVVVSWKFLKSKNKHVVTYGLQVKEFSGRDYGEIEAAHEYGECIAHAANCLGIFNV